MVVRSHIGVANIGSGSMASDTVVRARIDGQVKEKAAKVLADMDFAGFRCDPSAADVRGE
jgi:hypothetical protein